MNKRLLFLLIVFPFTFSCSREQEVPSTHSDLTRAVELQSNFDADKNNRHHYQLTLDVDSGEKIVRGQCILQYQNSSEDVLNQIKLRLLMNSLDRHTLKIESLEAMNNEIEFSISSDNSIVTIELGSSLSPGDKTVLSIGYTIDLKESPEFYFGFTRIDESGFSLPYAYPVAARYGENGWEEDPLFPGGDLLSADPAWFSVDIICAQKLQVASSGLILKRTVQGDKQRWQILSGPVRDFYICADVSYLEESNESGSVKILSFTSEQDRYASQKAIEITERALNLFSRHFGEYPFRQIVIASLPMGALGIEFPGFFAINDELYGDSDSFLFEGTVVHETAHQWFYGLVGNNQLRDPWIDEGLAQYAVWFYFREIYGSEAARSMENSFGSRWQRVERRKIPINKPVSYYREKEYSAIIYGRAPLFFLELKELLGEDGFHNFLARLVKKYSLRHLDEEAFREELFNLAGNRADKILGEYFD